MNTLDVVLPDRIHSSHQTKAPIIMGEKLEFCTSMDILIAIFSYIKTRTESTFIVGVQGIVEREQTVSRPTIWSLETASRSIRISWKNIVRPIDNIVRTTYFGPDGHIFHSNHFKLHILLDSNKINVPSIAHNPWKHWKFVFSYPAKMVILHVESETYTSKSKA